jgi:hypothetical protein
MRFESGNLKAQREIKKSNGKKLDFFERYGEAIQPDIDKILVKRKKEEEDRQTRQDERLKKIKEEEKKGKLFIKKIE